MQLWTWGWMNGISEEARLNIISSIFGAGDWKLKRISGRICIDVHSVGARAPGLGARRRYRRNGEKGKKVESAWSELFPTSISASSPSRPRGKSPEISRSRDQSHSADCAAAPPKWHLVYSALKNHVWDVHSFSALSCLLFAFGLFQKDSVSGNESNEMWLFYRQH